MTSVLISKWFINITKGSWSEDIFHNLYALWSWSVLVIMHLWFCLLQELFFAKHMVCFGGSHFGKKSNIINDLVDEKYSIIEYQFLTLKDVDLHGKFHVNMISFYVFLKLFIFWSPNKYPCSHPWNKQNKKDLVLIILHFFPQLVCICNHIFIWNIRVFQLECIDKSLIITVWIQINKSLHFMKCR